MSKMYMSFQGMQGKTDRRTYSLGEADVGADGVFVPALSGVVSGRVALVARGVLCRREHHVRIDVGK